MSRIAVLVPGKIHDRVLAQLKDVERDETLKLDSGTAQRIRGVALSGAFPAVWFEQLPNIEIVASFGVGYDGIDAKLAGSKGIIVTNTPDVLNDEVADTAIALLLNTIRELPKAEAWLRDGNWKPGSAYPLTRYSLKGRHVGLYGLGRIGLEIAKRLEPFKVKISYHTRSRHADAPYDYHPTLKGLAEAVDTLVAIVPKTPQTHKTVNADILSALGPDGIVVNVGRGWTVNEDDLIAALNAGTIGGAGLDVFYDEPNVPAGLLSAPNTVLVPHIGSASIPTRNAMADLVAENLISWFEQGKPVTPVAETPVKQ